MRIAPSLLSADFACLGQEVQDLLEAGVDCIHFDVMDNHYVPNLTFGPMVCQAIRPYSKVPIDVHLMVSPVDELVKQFARSGADIISFHPEASWHVNRTIKLIHDHGCKAGLAFNPATPLNYLDHCIQELDLILIMLVNPGFGGQQLIPQSLAKISEAKARITTHCAQYPREIWLEADGGITLDNVATVADAGANTLVMGSAIFGEQDYPSIINKIRGKLSHISC